MYFHYKTIHILMLAPLDNEVFFKKAFTNKIVFEQFIKDIFDVQVSVENIETEKKFEPKAGNIDFKLDIFAETTDKRFIIEIQRVDYDYNFDRFLHYFLGVIIQQQKKAKEYKIKQEVLAVIVLTQPYTLTQKNGEPLQDNYMSLDFNLKNLKGDLINIWGHNLVFLNPHPKYENPKTLEKYKDWLDLFRQSVHEKIKYTLNLNNPGISKAVDLINYDNMTSEELEQAKITEGRKIMKKIIEEKAEKKIAKKYEKKLEKKDLQIEKKDNELKEQAKLIEKLQKQLKNK